MSRKWNNGDLDPSTTRMQRVSTRRQEVIAARPVRVFARVGPVVEELLRAPALLHGIVPETLVIPTLRDAERYHYHAFLACGDLVAGKFDLELEDMRDGYTLVRLTLILTALSERGNALYDRDLEDRRRDTLTRIGEALQQPAPQVDETKETGAGVSASASASASRQDVVQGDPDRCFALACPVAELDWIDGWCFDLIYSESGRNEDNNIFLEPMSGLGVLGAPGANTYWYTTLYDTVARRFHAVLLTPDFMIAMFKLEMDDLGQGRTGLRWSLTYTGLNEKGQMIIAEPGFEKRMSNMLDLLGHSAKHYIETGEMYRVPVARRVGVLISVIGAAVGRHLRRYLSPNGQQDHQRATSPREAREEWVDRVFIS